jgi:hypothetical protein
MMTWCRRKHCRWDAFEAINLILNGLYSIPDGNGEVVFYCRIVQPGRTLILTTSNGGIVGSQRTVVQIHLRQLTVEERYFHSSM